MSHCKKCGTEISSGTVCAQVFSEVSQDWECVLSDAALCAGYGLTSAELESANRRAALEE